MTIPYLMKTFQLEFTSNKARGSYAVSYTHLTLPTIYSV